MPGLGYCGNDNSELISSEVWANRARNDFLLRGVAKTGVELIQAPGSQPFENGGRKQRGHRFGVLVFLGTHVEIRLVAYVGYDNREKRRALAGIFYVVPKLTHYSSVVGLWRGRDGLGLFLFRLTFVLTMFTYPRALRHPWILSLPEFNMSETTYRARM